MIIKIKIMHIIMRSIGTFIQGWFDDNSTLSFILVFSDGARPNLDKLEAHYHSPTNIIVTYHPTQSPSLKAIPERLMNTYYSLNLRVHTLLKCIV